MINDLFLILHLPFITLFFSLYFLKKIISLTTDNFVKLVVSILLFLSFLSK